MTCGDYDDGYMAGLEGAHAELRVWQLGDHAATCDCEPWRLCGSSWSTSCWPPKRPSPFRTSTSRDALGRAGSPVRAGATRRGEDPRGRGPRNRRLALRWIAGD